MPKISAIRGGLLAAGGLVLVKQLGAIAIFPIAVLIGAASWLFVPVLLAEPTDESGRSEPT